MTASAIEIRDSSHWQIFGPTEFDKFFRALHLIIPAEARMYFEGTSISKDMKEFFSSWSIQPDIQVKKSTIFPKPSIFYLPFTLDIVEKLCELSLTHAQPEMFDHFKFYLGNNILLAAWDFDPAHEPVLVSDRFGQDQIKAFCDATGCQYRKIADRKIVE